MKKIIIEADKKMTIKKCGERAPMIAKVAESPGWAKLWDHTLDLGWKTVQGLKMLSCHEPPWKRQATMSPV